MDPIRTVLIVGAGAVGSALGAIIESRLPGSVSVLADAARQERYRREGFILNGRRFDFRLVSPEERSEPDLILVAVKNAQLPGAITQMTRHVGPDTLILSLMNGITSEDELAADFGWNKVLYAMILGIDAVREGTTTSYSAGGTVHFGEAVNAKAAWSPRVERIAEFFGRSGVSYSVPEDMKRSLWYKFMINVGINQCSAVLRARYRLFQSASEARALMEAVMREVIALSAALGTGLVEADIAEWYGTLMRLGPEGMTSMLQDIEAGRKTEVESFAGTVVELGRRSGVDVPLNEALLLIIRALEAAFPLRT
ncbi:MAG TPA: ketopantoate reductase family protein [Rectinemataceae bacterium]|nr:ketopantoate reductase family protein [Rectinemataceae bacterium]